MSLINIDLIIDNVSKELNRKLPLRIKYKIDKRFSDIKDYLHKKYEPHYHDQIDKALSLWRDKFNNSFSSEEINKYINKNCNKALEIIEQSISEVPLLDNKSYVKAIQYSEIDDTKE